MLGEHCAQARFVWNLALEQQKFAERYRPYRRGRRQCWPSYVEQNRQLTEARAAEPWLASGSVKVQQQALRDFAQAMKNYWAGTHGHPKWRRKDVHEGFRIVAVKPGHVRRLNRRTGEVLVPKVGWVRFRWTRAVGDAASFRVTLDRVGRWHLAFAQPPGPLERAATGAEIGIDRGVANTLATSNGTIFHAPSLTVAERARLARLQRTLSRQQKASGRRQRTKRAIARLRAREADRVKDWVEQTTTKLVREHDLVAVERLQVRSMTRSGKGTVAAPGRNVRAKAGLNREILARRWGMFLRRLKDKAALAGVEVVEIDPRYTSQRCSCCGHTDPESRESQSRFRCRACGGEAHADFNAARNILAAGRAVTARGGVLVAPLNREPQLVASQAAWSESPGSTRGRSSRCSPRGSLSP
jgi:IS605 OrfB family transposase